MPPDEFQTVEARILVLNLVSFRYIHCDPLYPAGYSTKNKVNAIRNSFDISKFCAKVSCFPINNSNERVKQLLF